jgi:Flp pilus assembly protein TadG
MKIHQRCFLGFIQSRRAAVAVEFAFISVILIEFIVEIMQAGLYYYTASALERTSAAAARQIFVGSAAANGYNASQFLANVVCPSISATNLPCSNLILNVQQVQEGQAPAGFYAFLNGTQTGLALPPLNNSQTSFCIGQSGSYVYMQFVYAMPVFSPFWQIVATTFNGTSSFLIQKTAVFRNEPFQASASSC